MLPSYILYISLSFCSSIITWGLSITLHFTKALNHLSKATEVWVRHLVPLTESCLQWPDVIILEHVHQTQIWTLLHWSSHFTLTTLSQGQNPRTSFPDVSSEALRGLNHVQSHRNGSPEVEDSKPGILTQALLCIWKKNHTRIIFLPWCPKVNWTLMTDSSVHTICVMSKIHYHSGGGMTMWVTVSAASGP